MWRLQAAHFRTLESGACATIQNVGIYWVRSPLAALEQEILTQTWFIFNNTTKGHALVNLEMLRRLLEDAGLPML